MSFEITGTLFEKMAKVEGVGRNGSWQKIDFVIETDSQYPKKVCFTAWKDLVDRVLTLPDNAKLKIKFDVESNPYTGKYYTNLKAYQIEQLEAGSVPPPPIAPMPFTPQQANEDHLPF